MDQAQKRKLENELLVMGLKSLKDPDLVQQMADMVSAWHGDKHEFLRDLLNECDADLRSEMYQAIAPKLKFKALSFGDYEARIAEKAGQMISQRRMRVEGDRPKPIEVGDKSYLPVPKEMASHVVATMRCHTCHVSEQFVGADVFSAIKAARNAGWKLDLAIQKECCSKCPLTEKRVPIALRLEVEREA